MPAIDQLADQLDLSLAISLHASNDVLRDRLVPVNRRYPIAELLSACKRYMDRFAERKRVTIEYIMLDQVNDGIKDAKELAKLLSSIPCKVNLIPFNPFPHSPYRRSSDHALLAFQDTLRRADIVTTIRKTRGDDITAACGQLVGKVEDRTRRQARWSQKIETLAVL